MASLRYFLLAGVTLPLLLGPAVAWEAQPGTEMATFRLAQAESGTEEAAKPPAVVAAEKAVEEARAGLRDAMATGGDVPEARRKLHAALETLEEVRRTGGTGAAENTDDDDTGPATEAPADEAPGEAEDIPTLAEPDEDIPTLSEPDSDSETTESETAEPPPPPPVPEPDESERAAPGDDGNDKEPGFIRRLFGFGQNGDEEADEPANTGPSRAETDDQPPPTFADLPPLEGPKTITVGSNAELIRQEDERIVLRDNGRMIVKHDDIDRFRRNGEEATVESGEDGDTVTTVTRDNGAEIVTLRSRDGDILRRSRKRADGEVEILIGARDADGTPRESDGEDAGNGEQNDGDRFDFDLPELAVDVPRQQYIVDSSDASRTEIEEALAAAPVEAAERPYSLEEIKRSSRLRAKLRRVDIDTINFPSGSATIDEDQVAKLQAIGNALASIIANDPTEVFLIEGHTDAVGSEVDNLALSDRRADALAEVLTYYFDIPPENLITQGYGEEYLKVLTAEAEPENRRASVRRITPLLVGQS